MGAIEESALARTNPIESNTGKVCITLKIPALTGKTNASIKKSKVLYIEVSSLLMMAPIESKAIW